MFSSVFSVKATRMDWARSSFSAWVTPPPRLSMVYSSMSLNAGISLSGMKQSGWSSAKAGRATSSSATSAASVLFSMFVPPLKEIHTINPIIILS